MTHRHRHERDDREPAHPDAIPDDTEGPYRAPRDDDDQEGDGDA